MVEKVVPIRGRECPQNKDADLLLEVRERIVKIENPVARQLLREALRRATLTIVSPYQ